MPRAFYPVLACALLMLLVATAAPVTAGPEPGDTAAAERAEKSATYCPRSVLVFGRIVIQARRCYALYLLRDSRGLFLVFAQPGARIPPGQFVRLTTPAGAKLKGRIFYLVPVRGGPDLPLNTVLLTTVRIQDLGRRLIISAGPGRNTVTVTFTVR